MNTKCFGKGTSWLLVFIFLFLGVPTAKAEIQLWGDKLTVVGFLRHQTVFNMGTTNPYNSNPNFPASPAGYNVQDDKNDFNLNRTWFVTEWTFKPNDVFKLYLKARVIEDSTTNIDDELFEYNAHPFASEHYGSTMRLGHDNHIKAEAWELYADINLNNLWLRLGKQQIVWGEMISARIMDVVNPLDQSWHFKWEPEEFENIRIPLWMIRGIYNIEQNVVPWLDELYIEGFWNPGDIEPNINPPIGNPYRLNYQVEAEWGGLYVEREVEDRRGRDEFGFRIGYKLGLFAGTFNYAHLYTDDEYSMVDNPGPPPSTWPFTDKVFPQIDVYGMTLNYAFDRPLNTVVTIEVTYVPDTPYYDDTVFPGIAIKESDTVNYAINLQRFSKILSSQPFMNVIFQYQGKYIKDYDEVKLTPAPNTGFPFLNKNNIAEKIANDAFVLSLSQDFCYKTYKATCVIIWQPDGSYRFTPGFKYSPGDNWRFEVFANWWGGSAFDNANKHQLNYFHYQDEIMARITYQF